MKDGLLSKIVAGAVLVAAPFLGTENRVSMTHPVANRGEYSATLPHNLAIYSPSLLVTEGLGTSSGASDSLEEILGQDLIDFVNGRNIDVVHGGFTKYAYGNVAEGLLNVCSARQDLQTGCVDLIDKIAEAYMEQAPSETDNLRNLGLHGNYLSNLNLILGVHRQITGSDQYRELNERVTRHLANVSRTNDFHFPSYPGETQLFPADQAFVLYTIHLFDQNYGTNISEPLIEGWKQHIVNNATHGETGLPISDITKASEKSNIPRGSANSYLVLYTSKFDTTQAREWWNSHKEHFLKTFLGPLAGFREYHATNYGEDVDSGPIMLGVGASATAFGIGAARSMREESLAGEFSNLLGVGNFYAGIVGGKTERVARDVVAQAIRFNMSTQPQNQ